MPYIAYYDTSGTEKDGNAPLVVAGLLSTAEKWRALEHAWHQEMGRFGVPYLHMKDLAHWRGPYEVWNRDEGKRRHFMQRLIGLLGRVVERSFVIRIIPADYYAVNERYHMSTWCWPTPYPFAALMCTTAVELWMLTNHASSHVHHVFETGDVGQGSLVDLVQAGAETSLSIVPKIDSATDRWLAAFQAADLVAYEHRLAIGRMLGGNGRPTRQSLRALRRCIPHETKCLDRRGFFAMCRNNPGLYPRREHINYAIPDVAS